MSDISDLTWFDQLAGYLQEVDSESHQDQLRRVLPRFFVTRGAPELVELARSVQPVWSCDLPGLCIEYRLDFNGLTQLVTHSWVQQIGINLDALHDIAMANLGLRFPSGEVRRVLETGEPRKSQKQDVFESAQVLLVPYYLHPGEQLAAAIPYSTNLVLNAVEETLDGQPYWEGFRARLAEGLNIFGRDRMLCEYPIRATSNGLEAMS